MRKLFLLVLVGVFQWGHAQFNLPSDTVLCPGTDQVIPSGFKSISTSTVLTLSDDQYSGIIQIGFPFTFYGVTYTELVISSNNYVTFNTGNAGGFSPWAINANIPNNTNAPLNSIMCPWQDINPGIGGTVEFGIAGVAPNRAFTISYCEIPMFSCTQLDFTNQIVLFEGSNRIETHIGEKNLCQTWNGGVAIHGLQNAAGTVAHVVPGRNFNNPIWSTLNEGTAFIPDSTGFNYTIQPISYDPSVFNPINWYTLSGQLFATGDSLVVNLPQGSVETFTVSSAICGGTVYADTVTVYIPSLSSDELQPSCENENNGVVFIDLFDQNPFRYNIFLIDETDSIVWASKVNRNEDTAYGIAPGKYTIVVTDTNSCMLFDTVIVASLGNVLAEILPVSDTLYDTLQVVQTFYNGSTGAVSYTWSGNAQVSVDTNATFTFDTCGTFWISLIAENANGCRDSTAYPYVVKCYIPIPPEPEPDTSHLAMPNAFTPNGDGVNDYFNAVVGSQNLEFFEAEVLNRYGVSLYKWRDWQSPELGWDGKNKGTKVADGVYFYVVKARGTDKKEYDFNGVVHVMSSGAP